MDKRGFDIPLKVVLGALIGVIVVLLLIVFIVSVVNYFGGQNDLEKAKGSLNEIVKEMTKLSETNKEVSVLLTNPVDWYVVSGTGSVKTDDMLGLFRGKECPYEYCLCVTDTAPDDLASATNALAVCEEIDKPAYLLQQIKNFNGVKIEKLDELKIELIEKNINGQDYEVYYLYVGDKNG